jgi:hypothetical protein
MRAHTISLILLAACGSSGTTPKPDAPKNIGFNKPLAALHANMQSGSTVTDLGPADLSCLGTASADQATTVAVTLATVVKDFQNHTLNGGATDMVSVSVFKDENIGTLEDTQMSMATGCPNNAPCGNVTVTVPVGTKRFGFKMTDPAATPAFLPTFLVNQTVEPGMASQTLDKVQTVSNSTATLLPALIGEQRTPGTGVLAGAMRDCQKHEMSNFVATISSTSGTAMPIAGSETYYFQAGVDLPVHHCQAGKPCNSNEADSSSGDGLFMAIQLPPTTTAYVQIWGYTSDSAVGNEMTLVGELPVPVLADNVITGSYEPLRQ